MDPVKCFELPRESFVETQCFEDVLKKLSNHNFLHIHGFPGNGKTEICRALCQKKAQRKKKNKTDCITWSVQCSPENSEGDLFLKEEWKRLIKQLLINNEAQVIDDLMHNDGRSFVDALKETNMPVFLVVDDVSKKEIKLMQSVIRHLFTIGSKHLQLLIASAYDDDIFTKEDISKMDLYETFEVLGFTDEEAFNFLKSQCKDVSLCKDEEIRNLAKDLNFSILLLTLAKIYCSQNEITYAKYHSSLDSDDCHNDIVELQEEQLERHPDIGKDHTYKVIMKLLRPEAPKPTPKKKGILETMFEVMKFLSFLDHENIPEFLIGKYYQMLECESDEEKQLFVKQMVARMKKIRILSVSDDKPHYGESLYSTHRVILSVIRNTMKNEEKRKVIMNGMKVISIIVTKDNRLTYNFIEFSKMLRHVGTLVGRLKIVFDSNTNSHLEDFEAQLSLSRIYEILSFINAQQGKYEENNIAQALDYLWKAICRFGTKKNRRRDEKELAKEELFNYKLGKKPVDVAKEATDSAKYLSRKIDLEFVETHYSTFFPVNLQSLIDMEKSEMAKDLGINLNWHWSKIKSKLKVDGCLSIDQTQELERNKFLLTPEQLKDIFLLERIASVLHTHSRLILNIKDKISKEEQERFEWYREVGIEICQKIYEVGGIHSLFEFILILNNKLPRLAQRLSNEQEKNFIERLEEVREVAKGLLEKKEIYYENGIYKTVFCTPSTLLSIKKSIVKANTKLYKHTELADSYMIGDRKKEALKICNELYALATEHTHINIAVNSKVHAGKFYAAVGMYDKAVEAIDSAFTSSSNQNSLQTSSIAFPWALHNYGRAISIGCLDKKKFSDHYKKFGERFDAYQKSPEREEHWKNRLNNIQLSQP